MPFSINDRAAPAVPSGFKQKKLGMFEYGSTDFFEVKKLCRFARDALHVLPLIGICGQNVFRALGYVYHNDVLSVYSLSRRNRLRQNRAVFVRNRFFGRPLAIFS